jgi:acyl-[acyl-carrier-protein]-phospholipid O-acyltransferase/long-chain-fatty-acid--[acyl-carrier-protein] ligase
VVGLLTALLTVASVLVLPDFLVRFVVVFITRVVYKLNINGAENIPVKGGALIAPNHVTYVDALLLSATVQRRIRFVMIRRVYENKWLNPLFRLMKIIPIAPDDPPREILKSLKAARTAMDEGYLVCLFPEGALTLTGNMRQFRPGLERILKGSDYPIIPAHIGGAWGSIFSYFHGNLLGAWPRVIPYPVSITYGEPMPTESSSLAVRDRIALLAAEAYDTRKGAERTLVHAFVKTARKAWRKPAIGDSSGKELTFGKTLIGSIALSREIDRRVPNEEYVGVLLPSVVGGAIVNVALTLTGRVPVNINFTSSRESVDHAIALSDLKTIITSRAFMEKLEGFEVRPGTIYMEDIMPCVSGKDKLIGLFKALFARPSQLMTFKKPAADDVATIIFSSGSTGVPKGVMLTHHNIMSNMDSFAPIFRFSSNDRVLGCLPLFHSFGFTATLWCPLTMGFYAYYHPNPMDGSKIAEIIREQKLTILITTPTFLLAYIRRAKREDFVSLRGVVTGAEKLKRKVADTFEERFGIRPREGYGTTELSPVVGVSVDDGNRDGEIFHVGTKEGSIGHPIPGVAARIVDPATMAPLDLNQEGLLLIKGPNVMLGYLKDPEKTKEVLKDGWYNTGDVGRIDEDGFIFLTDRLSRFSKIAGEMVPHLGIEEKILEALGTVNQVIAISAVPDERKGEAIVLLYTVEAGTPESLKAVVDQADIPNLWKPRAANCFQIDAVPTLGTGKLDLKQIKTLAKQFKGVE